MWPLDFHPLVEADLTDAAGWYEREQPQLGDRFLAEAAAALARLPQEALHYSVRLADIRRLNLPSFPHGIFYLSRTTRSLSSPSCMARTIRKPPCRSGEVNIPDRLPPFISPWIRHVPQ